MIGPLLNYIANVSAVGYKSTDKEEYQRHAGMMCLTGRIVYHGPSNEVTEYNKKEIVDGLNISMNDLDRVFKDLGDSEYVLFYKNIA